MLKHDKIIIYDGICNLCDGFILFVIDNDKKNKFKFTPLQDEFSKTILKESNKDFEESILFYRDGIIFSKSSAVIQIFFELGFPFNLIQIFMAIPKFVRDKIYDFVARNRYKWFGKRVSCRIPTKELLNKFISYNN